MARVVVVDPSRSVAALLGELAARSGVTVLEAPTLAAAAKHLHDATAEQQDAGLVCLIAATAAKDLVPLPPTARVVVFGEVDQAARIASAAANLHAATALIVPTVAEALAEVVTPAAHHAELEVSRTRALVGISVLDLGEDALADGLGRVSRAFLGDDCIVWWREGDAMRPRTSRPPPIAGYRTLISAASRIAAAAHCTVVVPPLPDETVVRSVAAVALSTSANEVTGLLAVVADRARQFGANERADLVALGPRVARELSWRAGYLRLVSEGDNLRASVLHDPLTGMLTRLALEQAASQEVAAATRRGESLSLLVVDVVGMRRFNLRHGHRMGDELLSKLSTRLRANVRSNDPVGRFGGDELAVLLTGADVSAAEMVAHKLLEKLSQPPIEIDGVPMPIELRCVVAPFGSGERSGEAAFARAASQLRFSMPGIVVAAMGEERQLGAEMAQSALSIGATLGGTYRVKHELSRGAMGVVYRGEDIGLGRPVAIKVLRSDLASDHDLVERFRAEAAMLASLRHNNLVSVYSLGEFAGDVYFVMELVEGQPLSDVLRSLVERGEWFPPAAIAQITLEIGDALDAMHAVGLIHRDVKPANILLDRDRDRAVLVDVGVAARAGDRSEAAGTPGFSAPESFLEGAEASTTDVYGLAATVYCMLTCQPPFGIGNLAQLITKQLHEPLPKPSAVRPELGEAVDRIIHKALDPDPSRRWASASAFAMALSTALERLAQAGERQRMQVTSPPAPGLLPLLEDSSRQPAGVGSPMPTSLRGLVALTSGAAVSAQAGVIARARKSQESLGAGSAEAVGALSAESIQTAPAKKRANAVAEEESTKDAGRAAGERDTSEKRDASEKPDTWEKRDAFGEHDVSSDAERDDASDGRPSVLPAATPAPDSVLATGREVRERSSRASAQMAAAVKADDEAHVDASLRQVQQREGRRSGSVDEHARAMAVNDPSAILSRLEEERSSKPQQLRSVFFRVAARVMSHRYGAAKLRTLTDADPALRPVLAASASPLGWDQAAIFAKLVGSCGPAPEQVEVSELIGRAVMSATFAQFYGVEPASVPPEKAARALPSFWGRYHQGVPPTVEVEEGRAVVELGELNDPVMIALIRGQLHRMLELCGARDVRMRGRDGNPYRFTATWSAAEPPGTS